MNKIKTRIYSAGIVFLAAISLISSEINFAQTNKESEFVNLYSKWKNGPPTDPSFFPIGVWYQAINLASQYKAAGINFYFAIGRGPRKEQLDSLRQSGMYLICHQSEEGLANIDDKTIIAWMHGDEPDNLRRDPKTNKRAPIPPENTIEDYHTVAAKDPTRPVMLNLGQGVANDDWPGRGPDATLDVYPEYCKGADIVSFDVYPVVNIRKPDGEKYLWYVAKGVDRLRKWTNYEKPVWNVIECTHIHDPLKKATPVQVRSEVWMSLIHGSKGICYFVHQFKPEFNASALLSDPEMLKGVTEINKQIHELAPALNSPTVEGMASVESSNPEVPIDVMVKKYKGDTYIFSVAMRIDPVKGTFKIKGLKDTISAEVIGEGRTVEIKNGGFQESFDSYGVHLYKIQGTK